MLSDTTFNKLFKQIDGTPPPNLPITDDQFMMGD